jgi:hypothetical protein
MKLIKPYGLDRVYTVDNFISFGKEDEFQGKRVCNIVGYTKTSKRILLIAFTFDDAEKNASEQEFYYKRLLEWLTGTTGSMVQPSIFKFQD